MTRNSRIGVGVCLAALIAVLAGATPVSAQTAKYFPADAEIVLTVNIRQIMESDLVKGNKAGVDALKELANAALQANEDAQKFFKTLDFDPFRDLDSVTTVMAGNPDPAKALVIVHGKFDAAKFKSTAEEAAKAHGDVIQISKAGAHQLIEITPPGDNKVICVSLANPTTLLVSQGKATVTAALTRAAAEERAELKKEVQDLLESRDAKASVSFVATSGALAELAKNAKSIPQAQADMIAAVLPAIEGLNGGITVGKDVDFALGIGTKNAESAKEFAAKANAGLMLGKVMLQQKAKQDEKLAALADVVKTLRVSAQGTTFIIRGQVSAAVLEKALKNVLPQ